MRGGVIELKFTDEKNKEILEETLKLKIINADEVYDKILNALNKNKGNEWYMFYNAKIIIDGKETEIKQIFYDAKINQGIDESLTNLFQNKVMTTAVKDNDMRLSHEW